MHLRKVLIAAVIVAMTGTLSIPVFAGSKMAYKRFIEAKTTSGSSHWMEAASVSINAPSSGYVVVSASGMTTFYYANDRDYPSLTLTLGKTSAAKGQWIFTQTPGAQPFQTFDVRMVFNVNKGTNKFYLNAASFDGTGGDISIETGSMTVEFYASSNVQPQAAPAGTDEMPQTETRPAAPQSNR